MGGRKARTAARAALAVIGVALALNVAPGAPPPPEPRPLADLVSDDATVLVEFDDPATLFDRVAAWPGFVPGGAALEELRLYADALLANVVKYDALKTKPEAIRALFSRSGRAALVLFHVHAPFLWNLVTLGVVRDQEGVKRNETTGQLTTDDTNGDAVRLGLVSGGNEFLLALDYADEALPEVFLSREFRDAARHMEHDGVTVLSYQRDRVYLGLRLYLMRLGGRLFIANSANVARDTIDLFNRKRANALSATAAWKATAARMAGPGSARSFINLPRLMGEADRALSARGGYRVNPLERAHHDNVDAVVDYGALLGMAFTSTESAGGPVGAPTTGTSGELAVDAAHGFFAAARGGPLNGALLDLIPADCHFAFLASFADPAAAFARLDQFFKSRQANFGRPLYDDWLTEFEKQFYAPLREWAGDLRGDIAIVGPAPGPARTEDVRYRVDRRLGMARIEPAPRLNEPDGFGPLLGNYDLARTAVVAPMKNPEVAGARYEAALAKAREAYPEQVHAQRLDHDGAPRRLFTVTEETAPTSMALIGDTLVACRSEEFLHACVAVADQRAKPLAKAAPVESLFREGAGDATKFFYLNLPRKHGVGSLSQRVNKVMAPDFGLALLATESEGRVEFRANLPLSAYVAAMIPLQNAEAERRNAETCRTNVVALMEALVRRLSGQGRGRGTPRTLEELVGDPAFGRFGQQVLSCPADTDTLFDIMFSPAPAKGSRGGSGSSSRVTAGGDGAEGGSRFSYVYVPPADLARGLVVEPRSILLYERGPWHGDGRWVGFADGGVAHLPEAEFQRLSAAQQVGERVKSARREARAWPDAEALVARLRAGHEAWEMQAALWRERVNRYAGAGATEPDPELGAKICDAVEPLNREAARLRALAEELSTRLSEVPQDARAAHGADCQAAEMLARRARRPVTFRAARAPG
ncbi:MAG: hypothetical protein HY719_10105 [Planctomycetes bacterium]|nr:hypothetical protein [Planctomycetota bacterium]